MDEAFLVIYAAYMVDVYDGQTNFFVNHVRWKVYKALSIQNHFFYNLPFFYQNLPIWDITIGDMGVNIVLKKIELEC